MWSGTSDGDRERKEGEKNRLGGREGNIALAELRECKEKEKGDLIFSLTSEGNRKKGKGKEMRLKEGR